MLHMCKRIIALILMIVICLPLIACEGIIEVGPSHGENGDNFQPNAPSGDSTQSGDSDLPNDPAGDDTQNGNPDDPTDDDTDDPLPEYDEKYISALITNLETAISKANSDRDTALDVLSADFDVKREILVDNLMKQGVIDEFDELMAKFDSEVGHRVSAIKDVHDARVLLLENMIGRLKTTDGASLTALVLEAEQMLSEKEHVFKEFIYHSRNQDGIACEEMDIYKICAECNALVWEKAEHQWVKDYCWNTEHHWIECSFCNITKFAEKHSLLESDSCTKCGYKTSANVLIIESIKDESKSLCEMIIDKHTFTVVNIKDEKSLPSTADELTKYDEVILVNISNRDMPEGFDEILYKYVNDLGGGMLTVGGNKPDLNPNDDMWEANAFTREDMFGTLYQRLLPVEIINYTPPTAVIFLVDTSGSMYQPSIPYEKSKLYAAIQGVKAALDGLTERDYVGVITLSDMPNEVLSLTSRTQRGKILDALDGIQYNAGGGTIFSPALEMAGRALIAHSGVINKHIVVITDGAMSNTDEERSRYCMRENANMGITMSIVGIDCTAYDEAKLCDILADQPNGGAQNFHSVKELDKIGNIMRDIVESPLLKDIQYQEFIPVIESDNSVVADIDPNNMPMLDGFYGSKLKEGAELILSNKYVPIYAQWTVGKGKVGSFMCDLNGTWSHDFIASDVGITIINKIISALSNSKDN